MTTLAALRAAEDSSPPTPNVSALAFLASFFEAVAEPAVTTMADAARAIVRPIVRPIVADVRRFHAIAKAAIARARRERLALMRAVDVAFAAVHQRRGWCVARGAAAAAAAAAAAQRAPRLDTTADPPPLDSPDLAPLLPNGPNTLARVRPRVAAHGTRTSSYESSRERAAALVA